MNCAPNKLRQALSEPVSFDLAKFKNYFLECNLQYISSTPLSTRWQEAEFAPNDKLVIVRSKKGRKVIVCSDEKQPREELRELVALLEDVQDEKEVSI